MTEHASESVTNIFTVDVEEYFNVESFAGVVRKDHWEKYPERVVKNTSHLLKLLDSQQIRGTFFILGWIAERYPGLVKDIYTSGHEIASHGFDHSMIHLLKKDEFRRDIRRTKEILEKITGEEVEGYRAPTFSIVEETSWAYEILIEEGYRYSSSVYPIWHDRYGWTSFGLEPRRVAGNHGYDLWEIPMSVGKLGPIRIPCGGGGYLRAYPLFITRMLFQSIMKEGRAGIVYIHPWELDDNHPKIGASIINRARHIQGIGGMERKLKAILGYFRFDTMANFLEGQRGKG